MQVAITGTEDKLVSPERHIACNEEIYFFVVLHNVDDDWMDLLTNYFLQMYFAIFMVNYRAFYFAPCGEMPCTIIPLSLLCACCDAIVVACTAVCLVPLL